MPLMCGKYFLDFLTICRHTFPLYFPPHLFLFCLHVFPLDKRTCFALKWKCVGGERHGLPSGYRLKKEQWKELDSELVKMMTNMNERAWQTGMICKGLTSQTKTTQSAVLLSGMFNSAVDGGRQEAAVASSVDNLCCELKVHKNRVSDDLFHFHLFLAWSRKGMWVCECELERKRQMNNMTWTYSESV